MIYAGDYAGGDSDEIEYELVIGPMTALTGRLANWGTKVKCPCSCNHRNVGVSQYTRTYMYKSVETRMSIPKHGH